LALAPVPAWAITLTFDELPTQPVDDLSFMGVTFDFKVGGVDSNDARYNSLGPGIINYVQDPSLEGTALGILTLDFANPMRFLQFGVALSTLNPLNPGVTVSLFDAALDPIGVIPLNTAPIISFSEGQFTYYGVPVARAVLDFNEAGAGRFALDNLTFVPEPATLVLVGAGLLAMGARRRRG
jgi:hypothetical protein